MVKRIKIDITKEEYNKYKSLIRRVNKKATSLIEEFTGKPMIGIKGVKTQKDDFLFLDFIIPEKKGVGLSKFKDIESFNKYIANLQDFMNPDFVENMTKKYRDNLPKRKSISIDNYEEPVRKDEEDTKEYDINSILDKAKSDKSVDYELDRLNRSYNASKLVDEVNKKYGHREETPEEKELVNLINTITELELRNRQKDAALLDLADDDAKEEDNSKTAASSIIPDTEETFYTGQLAVKEDDFEDFKDMQDDIKSNSALIKILVFIFIIITIAIGVVLANKYLELGLF